MKTRRILMLEHDPDDRYITKAFFDEYGRNIKIDFATNAEEFFEYLEKCGEQGRKYPALILMNMNIVPMNACGVLKRMKEDKRYDHIPVVVLCSARSEARIRECYEAGAASVIQKPDGHESMNRKILSFLHYWFQTVELAV